MKKSLIALAIMSSSSLSIASPLIVSESADKAGVFGKYDYQASILAGSTISNNDDNHTDLVAVRIKQDANRLTDFLGFETETRNLYAVYNAGYLSRRAEPYSFIREDYITVTKYDAGSAFWGLGVGYQFDLSKRFYAFSDFTVNYLSNPETDTIEWDNFWCEPTGCSISEESGKNPDPKLTSHMMTQMNVGLGAKLTDEVNFALSWNYKFDPNHSRRGLSDLAIELSLAF